MLLLQEYEDLDEYEEDGEEYEEEGGGEEEYEEEETHQPTQESLEYLELRQRLKEAYRKKMKKESGIANHSSREKNSAVRKDKWVSFARSSFHDFEFVLDTDTVSLCPVELLKQFFYVFDKMFCYWLFLFQLTKNSL